MSTKAESEEKYAYQLQRQNDLSINTLEGHNDYTRVVNSRYLISEGIEPTEENLQKLQEDTKAEIAEWERTNPRNPIEQVLSYDADQRERVTVATKEEVFMKHEVVETFRILDQARIPWEQIELIKRVYERSSDNSSSPYWGSLSVYELGRIHGIREERKRRKKASVLKLQTCNVVLKLARACEFDQVKVSI